MIIINLPTKKLAVAFAHPVSEKGKRSTTCKIFQLGESQDELTELSTGVTECSKQDNFSKARGRKIALARALCQHDYLQRFVATIFGEVTKATPVRCVKCGEWQTVPVKLDKAERTKIWETYLGAVR